MLAVTSREETGSAPLERGRFAYPETDYTSKNPRPENLVAAQKTAPRIFLPTEPKTHQEPLPQTLGTHQENSVFFGTIVLGCVVDPNSGAGQTAVGQLYGHPLGVSVWIAEHVNARFYPSDVDAVNSALSKAGFPKMSSDANGQQYVVFSGGPNYNLSVASPVLGELEGNINNRPSDLATNASNQLIGNVMMPAGTSIDSLVLQLIQNTTNYNTNKSIYVLVPSGLPNYYNSNSYLSGLLQSVGATASPSVGWRFVGYPYPVPVGQFTH